MGLGVGRQSVSQAVKILLPWIKEVLLFALMCKDWQTYGFISVDRGKEILLKRFLLKSKNGYYRINRGSFNP